jgi:beta-phosphoglucomutase-like phosphatase (HAD superfamily)
MSLLVLEDLVTQHDALFLDSDGTIGNTERVHAEIGARIMTAHGVPTTVDERFRMKGWGEGRIWDEMAARGTPIQIPKQDFIDAQTRQFVDYIREIKNPESIRRPGMLELIQAFRDAKKPVVIVSNTPTSAVEALKRATGLTDMIDDTITYDDIIALGLNKKPSPDGYDLARDRLGLKFGQKAFIVEDSNTGAEAAVKAKGLNTVAQITYDTLGEKCIPGVDHEMKDTGNILDIFESSANGIAPQVPSAAIAQTACPRGRNPAYDMKTMG